MPMRLSVPWAAAMLAAAVAALGLIGSDALWLVPLGHLVAHGHLPSSIPFASAPTHGWHDVPAGAQLVFWALYRAFGCMRGLIVGQAVAAAIGFGALAAGLRREAGNGEALLLWLAVPLIALWGNLHGGVLTGLALLACYVLFRRPRDLPVLGVSVIAAFANPELWHTPRYYESVFRTVVARRGEGLWAPLGTTPFDLVLVAAAVVLVAIAVVRGPRVRLWEAVALLGLAAETVHVARTGSSFLFLAAYPAARAWRIRAPRPRLVALAAVVLAVLTVALLVKGPSDPGSQRLAGLAARTGRPVLADAILGQQVVLVGGRVWVDNPIDAFRRSDQQQYIDWLDGKPSGAPAVAHAAFVLVERTSHAGRQVTHDARLVLVASDKHALLYRVSRAAGSRGRRARS